MTAAPATLPDDPGLYCLYDAQTTEEQARQKFTARYGVEPGRVFRMYGAGRELWAGPVPRKEPGNE